MIDHRPFLRADNSTVHIHITVAPTAGSAEAMLRSPINADRVAAVIKAQVAGLPSDCPVTPLGTEGDLCWYLDASGSMWGLPPAGHSKMALHSLFSPHGLYAGPDQVARDLIEACRQANSTELNLTRLAKLWNSLRAKRGSGKAA